MFHCSNDSGDGSGLDEKATDKGREGGIGIVGVGHSRSVMLFLIRLNFLHYI